MIVFVTGASSGFGAEIVRRFAARGARVVAAARRTDRLDALAAELGPSVHTLALDVRDRSAVLRRCAVVAGIRSVIRSVWVTGREIAPAPSP